MPDYLEPFDQRVFDGKYNTKNVGRAITDAWVTCKPEFSVSLYT